MRKAWPPELVRKTLNSTKDFTKTIIQYYSYIIMHKLLNRSFKWYLYFSMKIIK